MGDLQGNGRQAHKCLRNERKSRTMLIDDFAMQNSTLTAERFFGGVLQFFGFQPHDRHGCEAGMDGNASG